MTTAARPAAAAAHQSEPQAPDSASHFRCWSDPTFAACLVHPSAMEHQNERAFQKQRGVFLNKKVIGDAKKVKKVRRVNEVGLGFKTPKEVSPDLQPLS